MVTILHPGYDEQAQALVSAPRPESLENAVVGIISNGKAGTVGLFDHLERRLRREWGVADVVRRTKSNYSAPAEAELMAEAAGWAVVFAGIGD